MKSLTLPAGQRTVIWTRRFSSMVTDCHLVVEPLDPGAAVSGTLEVTASRWIFPGTPVQMALQPAHALTAGMLNTFYTVAVTPGTPVKITRLDGGLNGEPPLVRKGFLIALALGLLTLAWAVWTLSS